jgi:hypothetical protein
MYSLGGMPWKKLDFLHDVEQGQYNMYFIIGSAHFPKGLLMEVAGHGISWDSACPIALLKTFEYASTSST